MKKMNLVIFLLSFSLLFTACFSSKKARIQDNLNQAAVMEKTETKTVEDTRQKVDDRLKAEVIDSEIADSVRFKINKYAAGLDSFKNAIRFISDKINTSGRAYRQNRDKIDSSFGLIDHYKSGANYRLRRFTMINESLDVIVNQQHMFDLAAFFGPGKFEIPDDKKEIAEKTFSPLIDSLVNFYNKYTDVERKATLVILGYADGSGFNLESDIFSALTTRLNDSTASKEKMNQKLSEWRAVSIGDLMEYSLAKKIPQYAEVKNMDFLFVEKGKGEAYPSKLVTDYRTEDERRRVVLLFWNILPK